MRSLHDLGSTLPRVVAIKVRINIFCIWICGATAWIQEQHWIIQESYSISEGLIFLLALRLPFQIKAEIHLPMALSTKFVCQRLLNTIARTILAYAGASTVFAIMSP